MSRGAGERFEVFYHEQVIRRDIARLDSSVAVKIRRAIESKLSSAPESFAKPLAYTRAGLWALRVGDWRVVFAIRGNELWILRIGHRGEVYQDLDSLLLAIPDDRS